MAWRTAKSLETLRNEVNERWPNRDKASDGVIGDAAHAASASDHNPNPAGVVCAFDITHDPTNGPDGAYLAELLRTTRHPDLKYVIWDHRMFSAYTRPGYGPFEWRPYGGADPHTNHVHVSVGVGPDGQSIGPYDDTSPWGVDVAVPAPIPQPQPQSEDDTDMVFIAEFADWPGKQWLVQPSTDRPPSYGTRLYIRDPGELDKLVAHGVRRIAGQQLGGTLYAEVKA